MAENWSFSDIFNICRSNFNKPFNYSHLNNFCIKEIEKDKTYELFFTFSSIGPPKLVSCIVSEQNFNNTKLVEFKTMFEDLTLKNIPTSLQEKLLAERKRVTVDGTSFYHFDEGSGNIIFKYGALFYSNFIKDNETNNDVKILNISNAINVTRNPVNWRLVSFVRNNNIFVLDVVTNECHQLSDIGEDKGSGCTHYIIQEEFDRYEGSWWRPTEDNTNEYHLLIEEYDESEVDIMVINKLVDGFNNEKYRYPKPGTKNAKSDLKLLKLIVNTDENSKSYFQFDCKMDLPSSLFDLFPDYEYLTNCGWTPDGHYVWIQLVERLQNKLATILVPIGVFYKSANYVVIFHIEENQKYWVPIDNNTVFLKKDDREKNNKDKDYYEAILTLKHTNFTHLYFIKKSWDVPKDSSFSIINSVSERFTSLTEGDWNVDKDGIWANEEKKIVYFCGNKDDPLSNFLYSLNYDVPNNIDIKQWTHQHSTVFLNPKLGKACIQKSTLTMIPNVYLLDLNSDDCANATTVKIYKPPSLAHIYSSCLSSKPNPMLLQYPIDNYCGNGKSIQMFGILFPPSTGGEPDYSNTNNISVKKKWPTLHYIYGGPGVRLIENMYSSRFYHLAEYLNYFGYALLVCDGRGSTGRGLEFEGHLKHKMGSVELDDQVFFLRRVAEETGLIDLDRVGVHGSSYGGYMTIMAMLKYNHVYKCGFSCSPVTDYRLYDTAYTERYLGIPQKDNDEIYEHASVLRYMTSLPRDKCRLAICHGGMDENVHLQHTAEFLEKSNQYGLDIKFLFYPTARHGINHRAHMESHMIQFLNLHLK